MAERRDRALNIVFRDYLQLTQVAFIVLTIMILPYVNKPAEETKNATPPGNVLVHIVWPPEIDADVDLWVLGPGEPVAVGYSNKGGRLFNLLRDDLGHKPDATQMNFETTYSRGIVAGEYVVGVHCYRCIGPIKVDMKVEVNTGQPGVPTKEIANASAVIKQNDEKTMLRFRLDKDGRLVPGSMNSVFKPLRAKRSGI